MTADDRTQEPLEILDEIVLHVDIIKFEIVRYAFSWLGELSNGKFSDGFVFFSAPRVGKVGRYCKSRKMDKFSR